MGHTVNNNRSMVDVKKSGMREEMYNSIRDFPMIGLINMNEFRLEIRFSVLQLLNFYYGGSI